MKASYKQEFNVKRGLLYKPILIIDGKETIIQRSTSYTSKGDAIKAAELVIENYHADNSTIGTPTVDNSVDEEEVEKSLQLKLDAVKDSFDDMSDDEYGNWLNGLPFDEFQVLMTKCME